LDYLDYLRSDTFSPKFKFESLFVFLTPYPNQTTGSSEQIDTGVRIFMAHRFEFVIFNVLKLSLDEGLMYYNKNGSLNLAYLNPSSLYHNLSDRNLFNAIASLELDYSFAPRWKAYLQFCIDQAKSTNEEENNAEPNAMGISGGLSFVNTVGKGTYTTNLEGAVTSPALYRRDKVDFVIAQRHIRFTNDLTEKAFYYVYDYLGFPYGGDAVVLQWENSFKRDSWQLEANFVSVLHGDTSMFTDLTTVNASTLLGNNTLYWTNVGTLKGSYEWENLHLTGTCEMDVIGKTDYDKSNRSFDSWSWDTQFVFGVKYVL